MKKFTLQLQNINGEVQQESEINIGENDVLVMHISESTTLATGHQAFTIIEKAMKTGGLAGLPSGISFTVIKQH